jgi:hypothetical protein
MTERMLAEDLYDTRAALLAEKAKSEAYEGWLSHMFRCASDFETLDRDGFLKAFRKALGGVVPYNVERVLVEADLIRCRRDFEKGSSSKVKRNGRE